VGRTAQAITWVLFIKWASMPSHERFSGIGIFFIIFFFLLFFAAVLSFKLAHKNRLTVNDAYQLILNTVAIYISVLFLLGYSADADIAVTTLAISAFTALQAVVFYASWKEEVFVTRMLSSLALTLFALFIYFNWTGFVVTLLWLLTAVIVFACGFRMKSVMARMTAIVLMGATLVKLLAIDSRTFTTVQKLVAYLVLGVLLLVISFFYQKYKQRIFTEDK
jgi:cbb3-type cytochrome oxidase subunit 3